MRVALIAALAAGGCMRVESFRLPIAPTAVPSRLALVGMVASRDSAARVGDLVGDRVAVGCDRAATALGAKTVLVPRLWAATATGDDAEPYYRQLGRRFEVDWAIVGDFSYKRDLVAVRSVWVALVELRSGTIVARVVLRREDAGEPSSFGERACRELLAPHR